MNKTIRKWLAVLLLLSPAYAQASKLLELRVVDKDYLMLHFRDGEVHYRDSGKGSSAYLGHSFVEGDDTLLIFQPRLDTQQVQQAAQWTVSSADDATFAACQPIAVWRKSKPMNTDHTLKSELDHWLFLQLPKSMRQGYSYTVAIPATTGSDQKEATIRFDVWNTPSEAIHVNLLGYLPQEAQKAADLYLWMGDGGSRDYHSWEGRKVYLYNVDTKKKQAAGTIRFWKHAADASHEAGGKNLVGTDVWNADFQTTKPGRYRLVIEGVGCSMDFPIASDIYSEPFRFSVRGYYYMRLGEPIDTPRVWPIPRQPQFIAETNPKGFTIYKTDLHPWHPDWRRLRGDVWDEPHFKPVMASAFWQHRLPGNPVTLDVRGGHSDAFDWDRHLAHVSNIYDLLLPFILHRGQPADDNLGIRESGNGLPDLLDEARNEVDFFLSIRDGEGYSQGVTNPSNDWTVMFQAGCTTMAAWANAANCAMMGEAMRLAGADSLCRYYTSEAERAFNYAARQENQQLDDQQGIGTISMRGRDFRQLAAAFLYNLTGDTKWEDIMAAESRISSNESPLFVRGRNGYCQLWAAAAYVTCPHPRHHTDLYQHTLASINAQADSYHLAPQVLRPSRRAASDDRWHTAQDVDLLLLAHHIATSTKRRQQLEQAMLLEAGWSLGRNPGNIVEMTGLGPRHITDVYSTGRNDGDPGTHPGQTPFNGTETWSAGDGGDARILLNRCYPSWNTGGWPRQESYFNQRYLWVNGEFTPRETMRGKMALLAYLRAFQKKQ